MNDSAVAGRILREYHLHGLPAAVLRRLGGSVRGASVTYRVAPPGEPPLVVRAFRADGPVLAQFSGTAAETMADWAVGRARTLARLAEAGYPAPRPVRARSGELIGTAGAWLTWASTYVEGPALRPAGEQLRLLGAALGRLHATGVAGAGPEPGRAAWHPEAAVATTLARLGAVAPLIPPGWQDLHAAFVDAAEAVRDGAPLLPEALVHGDAWPGNAVQAGPDEVTLIDWQAGGVGLPVLDLGNCLAECHLDAGLPPGRPEAWLVRPDEQRIAAVAAGYSAARVVPAVERDLLAQAVRFGAAFAGAIHFQAALTGGADGPAMDARLARLRNRLAVSDTIAGLALRHLTPPPGYPPGPRPPRRG